MLSLFPLTFRRSLEMRKIRNVCREYMTHNRKRISLVRQVLWYTLRYRPRFLRGEIIGKVLYEDQKPIGYQMVSLSKKGEAWLTGGLLPSARGKGFGESIFRDMVIRYEWDGLTCWLDVWVDNNPAVSLYQKLGFVAQTLENIQIAQDDIRIRLTMKKEPSYLVNPAL